MKTHRVLSGIAALLLIALVAIIGCGIYRYQNQLYTAEYGYCAIQFSDGRAYGIRTSPWLDRTPIYFRLATSPGVTYNSLTITEEEVKQIAVRTQFYGERQLKNHRYYLGQYSVIYPPRAGQTQMDSIQFLHDEGIEFSNRPDGPFLTLNSTKSAVYRLFGRPNHIAYPQPAFH